MLGVANAGFARRLPERRQVARAHPRQHQVLVVRDAQFAGAEAVGEIGGELHLVGRRVARRLAGALQRQRHRAVAREAMDVHVALEPARIGGGLRCAGAARLAALDRPVRCRRAA